ncbi:hypothetical protein [Humibacillus xanthopallidus]|uniref:hypothetical protein n=1 Tax=Humibacillus xanthopallidus TaxID=412689 RepID=UPI00384F6EC5
MKTKRAAAAGASALLAIGITAAAAPPAQAADFCASRIAGNAYFQRSFSHGGRVVATLCAPVHNVAGNATLYARGPYAGVVKYMKLTVKTLNVGTRTVDGNYAYSVYTYRPPGLHDYHAVMFDGQGNKIVDRGAYDYN